MKAENHSGVTHEKLIPIWEYSNNVFQKLLMIYVSGNFTLSPSQFLFDFGPFRQYPIVNLQVTPLWFSNLHIYHQSLHIDSSEILQHNHKNYLFVNQPY